MFSLGVPVFKMSNSAKAEEFYCKKLGFRQESVRRTKFAMMELCEMTLVRDRARVHLSTHGRNHYSGGEALILVDDVDALFVEFTANDVEIDLPPTDLAVGSRIMRIKDADGNCLRFMQTNSKKN